MFLPQLRTYDFIILIIVIMIIIHFIYLPAYAKYLPKTESKNSQSQELQLKPECKPSNSSKIKLNDSEFEDYGTFEDYDERCDEPIKDPLEPWNRFWFYFNDFFYLRITKPLYKGYEVITPDSFRQGLKNVLYNLQAPIRLVNSLLQGKIGQAWVELGKFMVNSTIGFGGFINITQKDKPLIPIEPDTANFGHTLAIWGFGEGIYLIWPILGPSTIRDTFGTIGDAAVGPFSWFVKPIGIVPLEYGLTTEVFLTFNKVNTVIDSYESITKSAIEPYVALRDAYVKYRRLNNGCICRVQP